MKICTLCKEKEVNLHKEFCEVYSLYRINFGELIDYARRRKNIKALLSQLLDNTDINEVTFVAKVGLVSRSKLWIPKSGNMRKNWQRIL
jgi:hypothetical protein